MWQSLENQFRRALQREGITVYTASDSAGLQALVRRVRDRRDTEDWIDLYFPAADKMEPGNTVQIGADSYLITTRDHRGNNGVYLRFNAVRCNQKIKIAVIEKGTVPDEFGCYPEIEKVVYEGAAYAQSELQGFNLLAHVGNKVGGYITLLMPAVNLNANTPIKLKCFDNKSNLVETSLRITSIDTTDCQADVDGVLHGILRLQIEP